jgi:protein-disulfide isomerase
MEKTKLEKYLTPLSVVLGALFIAGAIYWGDGKPLVPQGAPQGPDQAAIQKALENIAPITAEDHVRGSRDAEVFVVEYSDTECPFCKRFHSTMQQVMSEYESEGKVAWVYRHFPLDQLHAKARSEAVAFECAAELGGNDAFWKYADRLFEITPSNDGLDAAELPKIATSVGLDATAFASCLKSSRYDAHIEAEAQNAQATGGEGTPWSVVVTKDGKKYPLSGAQPYEAVQQVIETALKN